ncbi:major facilitator superfamily domain-containing protein [Jimgerdemannia flammicorona]|uniref:Major facilitator superfamily domain-containing protein n=1 Tax=Jimgerdemannia flammicorona TaxID=994334 RepID=A0A433Q1H6_9FUNG|nr:major facilitator superfamily domain-containing protein [Jimgerdemannia flammicorona]
MIIIGDIYSLEERPKYQSIVTSMFGLASVVGPLRLILPSIPLPKSLPVIVMGGAFVANVKTRYNPSSRQLKRDLPFFLFPSDKLSWRWDFWVNLIFGGIALTAIVLFLHIPHTSGSLGTKLKRVDVFGTLMEIATIVLLLLALNWGGNKYEWSSGPIIGLICGAVVLFGVFCWIEGWVAIEPVIPGRLFRRPVLVLIFICNFCLGLGFLGMLYYAPILFEVAYGTDSTGSGVRLIPLMLTLVLASGISAIFLNKVGSTQPFIIVGCALEVIGFGLFYTLDVSSSLVSQLGYLLITGAGLGLTFQNNILAAQAAADRKDMAIATGSMGGSIGIALYGSIMENTLKSEFNALSPAVLAQAVSYGADQSYLVISNLPDDIKPLIVRAYVNALHTVFLAGIPIAGVAFVCSLFIRTPKLVDMARVQAEREADAMQHQEK